MYSATHCSLTTAAVSGVRLLTRGFTYNQSSTSSCPSVATVVSNPALYQTLVNVYCVDVKNNLSTHSSRRLFYGCSFFLFIVLSSLCHCVYSRWQGFSCPSPLLWFVWVFNTCLSLFPGRLELYFTCFACWFINKVVSSGNIRWISCSFSLKSSVSKILLGTSVSLVLSKCCCQEKWKMKYRLVKEMNDSTKWNHTGL